MPKTTTVQSSTDYDQFSLFDANREVNRGHVESIKKAFEEMGNFTEKQPILVNEDLKIIDGQHRFCACKELGLPIFYTVQPGLGVKDARAMNILHRTWRLPDFAKSYADSGDKSYQKFLQLAEDYKFSYSVLMVYAVGEKIPGAFKDFREGDFVFRDVAAARARLDKLSEAVDSNTIPSDQAFAEAYLKVMNVPGFDQRRMVRKLSQVGEQIVRRFGSVTEYQRALEEVYNYQITAVNRKRLY